jgi:hypothetical protein
MFLVTNAVAQFLRCLYPKKFKGAGESVSGVRQPGVAPAPADQAWNQIFPFTLTCTLLLMEVVI